MKKCAICGFEGVSKDLCNQCYTTYCRDKNGNLIVPKKGENGERATRLYPVWVQELIAEEKHRRYQESITFEIPFGIDFGKLETVLAGRNGKVKAYPSCK